MQDFQQVINDPKVYGANQFAKGIGLFAGFMTMAGQIVENSTNNLFSSGLYSFAIGIAAYGIAFTISYTFLHIAPTLSLFLLNEQPAKKQSNVTILGPKETELKINSSQIQTEPEPTYTGWQENLNRHLNGKTFRFKNRSRILGDNFDPSWLAWIAQSRWEGKLKRVSERSLHSEAGVPRYPESKDPDGLTPAKQVISIFHDMELITPNNQAYVWSEWGEEVFPASPTSQN